MRPRTTRDHLRSIVAVVGLLLLSAVSLAACGGSDSTTSGSDSTGGSDLQAVQDRLDSYYKGSYAEPVGDSIKPPSGKNVWLISLGQQIEAQQNQADAIKQAGQALGWKITVVDGQFDPNKWLSGVEQAVAANADGIILGYVDCPPVKSGVEAAQAAGIPVVGVESEPCPKPLKLDWRVNYVDGQSFEDWFTDWGRAQADWVIAQTNGEANTVLTTETDLYALRFNYQGATEEFDKCGGCTYEKLGFVGADFGPALQQKIEQAFVQNPESNSFIASYDAVLTNGGAAALRGTGRLNDIQIMGGEGSAPAIQLIYDQSGNDACVGIPIEWEGYAAMDGLARLMLGDDPSGTNSGIGIQVCDADHNLPPKGSDYQSSIDYVAAYDSMWGVN